MTIHLAVWSSTVLSLLFAWVLWASFEDDQRTSGQWGCEMSWMTPSYRLIEWADAPIRRYKLYLYREQGWDPDSEVSTTSMRELTSSPKDGPSSSFRETQARTSKCGRSPQQPRGNILATKTETLKRTIL